MNLSQLQDNLEAEFDQTFDLDSYGESHIVQNKVKAFLRSATSKVARATIEAVRVERVSPPAGDDRTQARAAACYNAAIEKAEELSSAFLGESGEKI